MKPQIIDRLLTFWFDAQGVENDLTPNGPNDMTSAYAACDMVALPSCDRLNWTYGFSVGYELALELCGAVLEDVFADPRSEIQRAVDRPRAKFKQQIDENVTEEDQKLDLLASAFKKKTDEVKGDE